MSYSKVKNSIEAIETKIKRLRETIEVLSATRPVADVRVEGEYSVELPRPVLKEICEKQCEEFIKELVRLQDIDKTMAKIYAGLSK